MWTELPETLLATDEGARVNEILRSCVHCGFCNATCPTYQVTGDELDGPRGRIYLIKDLLEQEGDESRAVTHLDRCLTCRACETTCPSGVAYGELAEIARNRLGVTRNGTQGGLRRLFQWMVPNAGRLRFMARMGLAVRWLLPRRLASALPSSVHGALPAIDPGAEDLQVIVLQGCAQQVSTGRTAQVLQNPDSAKGVGVRVVAKEGCCGSLDLHLGDQARAVTRIKANIDALWPYLEQTDAILSSASGCGVTLKDYGRLLADDAEYALKAERLAHKVVDVAEFFQQHMERLNLGKATAHSRVAWHAPCTLQHGQKVTGVVESILERAGYYLVDVGDAHLCCGSAGTYSVMQPEIAGELRQRKIAALEENRPDVIATANVGCQTHLSSATLLDTVHWLELLE